MRIRFGGWLGRPLRLSWRLVWRLLRRFRVEVVILMFLLFASLAESATVHEPVSAAEGVAVLDVAKLVLGTPYVWAGQHVTGFDCSGLVVFAYDHTIEDMVWRLGDFAVFDVNADDLFRYNTIAVPFSDAQPGDLVFATRSDERITHIGLFSRWLDIAKTKFEWIQASSVRKAVVLDTWKLGQTNNGNRLVGLGRVLKWTPGTLLPMPTEPPTLPAQLNLSAEILTPPTQPAPPDVGLASSIP